MPLPTDRVDGQIIRAAELNAIGEAVNDLQTLVENIEGGTVDPEQIVEAVNDAVSALTASDVGAASPADVTTAVAPKADTTAVNAALAAKADVSALTSGLAAKADASALTAGLAEKETPAAAQAKADAAQAAAIQRANHTGSQAPSTITGTAVVTADARLSDARVPTDASVTPAKFAAAAINPAAGVAGARTLGTGATQAAPGNEVAAGLGTSIPLATAGDLYQAVTDRATTPGTAIGGVLRRTASVQVPWTYTQTHQPTDPAVGTALHVPIDVTITSHTGGSGPNLTTGWFGPRGVVNVEGVVKYGVDQNFLNFEPPGFFDGLRMENTAGVPRIMAPAWSYISSRMKIANGATVTTTNNDVNYGGAAFVDTDAYVTRNSGTIAGSATEVVSFLSQPVISGNVTTAGRVAYDAIGAVTGDDLYLGGPTIQSILAGSIGLTGADIGTEVIPYDIHFRAQKGSDRATHNIGLYNELGTVNAPVTATISSASSTIPTNSSVVFLNNTSGGAVTLTSTPTIRDGLATGQQLVIVNVSANAVTLRGELLSATSNIALTRTLNIYESVTLLWNATTSMWQEIAFGGGPTGAGGGGTVVVDSGTVRTKVSSSGIVLYNGLGDVQGMLNVAMLIGSPLISFGVGGSTAPDLYMQRAAAGVLNVGSAFNNATGKVATGVVRLNNYANAAAIGASVVGDMAVIATKVSVCTSAGTPGTWVTVGTQT